MSDEKPKPFAEAHDGRLIVGEVTVNYDFGESARISRDRFGDLAAIVNTAVKQREAKLRGSFREARTALDLIGQCDDHAEHECKLCEVSRSHSFDRQTATATLAKLADPGDYVPADEHEKVKAELAALRKHIEGAWGGLLEGLAEAEQWTTETLALAKALGLPGTDEKLRAEAAAAALMMEAQNCADRAAYTGGEFPRALRSLAGELQARANVYRVQAGLEPTSMDGSPIITAVDLGHEPSEAVTARVEPDGSLTVTRPQSRAIAFATAEAAQQRVDDVLRRYVEARWELADVEEREHRLYQYTYRGPIGDRMVVLAHDEPAARIELRARLASLRENGTRPSGFVLAGVE
jgi:hypothetical protein